MNSRHDGQASSLPSVYKNGHPRTNRPSRSLSRPERVKGLCSRQAPASAPAPAAAGPLGCTPALDLTPGLPYSHQPPPTPTPSICTMRACPPLLQARHMVPSSSPCSGPNRFPLGSHTPLGIRK